MATDTIIASGRNCAPVLTPKLAPWMRRFTQSSSSLAALLDTYGSPLHVTVASEFKRNAADLLSAITNRGVRGGLFFARKANKLPWFVNLAKEQGLGVDTASLTEVRETLSLGVLPENIGVTAIGKSPELVSLAVARGCLLVIDNVDELKLIGCMAHSLGKTARIGLRFSGFKVGERTIYSRFGLPISDFRSLLSQVSKDHNLQLELLHAHLDRYDIEERATAARQLLEIVDAAKATGHDVSAIDMGGGILMRYLENESEWQQFTSALVESVAGEREPFTFQSDGFGLMRVGDKVIGKPELYPVWNSISKERFIGAVLDHSVGGAALFKEISGRGLKLYFEPGRALLDNTGMTIARVTYRKHDTHNNLLVGLAMNRTNLRPFRAEFCVDPIFPSSEQRVKNDEGAFLVGSLCGESDIIMRRRLRIDHFPEPGDVVCFANTAGYLAHHLEVGTHGDPLPANVLVDEQTFEVREAVGISPTQKGLGD